MSIMDLDHLVRKYYGYVADLEGSGVEILDLLFVRDKIQVLLNQLTPEKALPTRLYEHIYELDALLWEERRTFLVVLGEQELRHARQQQSSPRSHWWWYIDELRAQPEPVQAQRQRLAQSFTPARG